MIAASDENRKMIAIDSQVSARESAINGLIAANTPSAVATPFPPLKPKKRGKRWPENAPAPASATAMGSAVSDVVIRTGIAPLRMSPIRVKAAASLLPRRYTLVAPGLPEPAWRGSGSPMRRETITALEMDPIR